MIETVRANFEGFTRKHVAKAILTCRVQAMVAHPPDEVFKQLVSTKSLVNSGVTNQDITNARTLFGPKLPRLMGAKTRVKPTRVKPQFTKIPRDFYALHRVVTLAADVLFVNRFPFLVTQSRNIRLLTLKLLPNWHAATLSSLLTKVLRVYSRGGFHVKLILMDMEFECLKDTFSRSTPQLLGNTWWK